MRWIRHESRRRPLAFAHRRNGSRTPGTRTCEQGLGSPAKDARAPTPLERWLAAESLMSLCVMMLADLRESHRVSRLLLVACDADGPSGWALMPRDDSSHLVEDWLAQFDRESADRPGEAHLSSFMRVSGVLDVGATLRRAGFAYGVSVRTGRAVSYQIYWGRDGLTGKTPSRSAEGPAVGSVGARAASGAAMDDVFAGPLWSQIQVALNNMARMEYLRELSHIDSLTCSFNRRYFNLRLTEEISRARRFNRPLSLVVFDVDRFKELNDAYGHQVGDTLLQRLADHVHLTVRSIDLLCRIGGDEFAVLMPDTDVDDCTRFGQRLRTSLSTQHFAVDARQMPNPLLVSLGGAVFPRHTRNAEGLLWCADMALLEAKQQGRDRFVLYTDALGSCLSRQPGGQPEK